MRPLGRPRRPGRGGPGGGNGNATSSLVPILLYHSVSTDDGGPLHPYTMAPARFRAHMAWIAEQRRSTMTVSEYAAVLRGEAALPDRPLVVTFDDGYADVFRAAEVMIEYGIRATLYVTTAPIGETRRGTLAGRPMLSWSELRELHDAGVEIGAHSHDHVQLDLLPRRAMTYQITVCKHLLQDRVQVQIGSFAYPHGYHSRRVREAVQAAGYGSACAVKNALSHPSDDPWALGRVMLERDDTVERLRAVCEDGVHPLSWRGERPLTRGWRAVRRVRTSLRPGTLTPPTTPGT
jgi:peptidoglycan/xylan/chitin deacetylase (PgdA/CDA1 family)